jgi:hypothetical protein
MLKVNRAYYTGNVELNVDGGTAGIMGISGL